MQAAADLAPGTGQQNGKTGVNPIAKAFATPTRGLGDKAGENEVVQETFWPRRTTCPATTRRTDRTPVSPRASTTPSRRPEKAGISTRAGSKVGALLSSFGIVPC